MYIHVHVHIHVICTHAQCHAILYITLFTMYMYIHVLTCTCIYSYSVCMCVCVCRYTVEGDHDTFYVSLCGPNSHCDGDSSVCYTDGHGQSYNVASFTQQTIMTQGLYCHSTSSGKHLHLCYVMYLYNVHVNVYNMHAVTE